MICEQAPCERPRSTAMILMRRTEPLIWQDGAFVLVWTKTIALASLIRTFRLITV